MDTNNTEYRAEVVISVSHNCMRNVFVSTVTVFETKSTPTVGYTYIISTCSLPVKLSNMKRLITDVFPTDWSPNRTILHFTTEPPYITILNIEN